MRLGDPPDRVLGGEAPLGLRGRGAAQLRLMDVPEGEYVVFEHGPFDYEGENRVVEERIEAAMAGFDYTGAGCRLDLNPRAAEYFYYDPGRCFKYARPVERLEGGASDRGEESGTGTGGRETGPPFFCPRQGDRNFLGARTSKGAETAGRKFSVPCSKRAGLSV